MKFQMNSTMISRGLVAVLLIAVLASVAGCSKTLNGSWTWWGDDNDVPAEPERIAIVCRGNAADAFSNPEIASRLADAVSRKIDADFNHAEVVSQSEINNWLDNNSWNGPLEIGRALDADIVLAIDIKNYSILDSTNTTSYRGTADLRVQTVICSTGQNSPPAELTNVVFPEEGAVQAGRTTSYLFSQGFVEELSGHVVQWMIDGPPEDQMASVEDDTERF